jgi:hypothetical protein
VIVGFTNNNSLEGEEDYEVKECQVVEVHLMNMKKPPTTWKPHYHSSSTWAFFQMNNNQAIDFIQNQII